MFYLLLLFSFLWKVGSQWHINLNWVRIWLNEVTKSNLLIEFTSMLRNTTMI